VCVGGELGRVVVNFVGESGRKQENLNLPRKETGGR
jgi:hypothetical protein